jgi:VanZ family protein
MERRLLGLICIAVLCTILALGLWPFHAPRNAVTWLEYRNGLRFDKYGTVVSSGHFRAEDPQSNLGATLEIWLQPNRIWDSGTVLAFSRPGNVFSFSLQQVQIDLTLTTLTQGDTHRTRKARLRLKNVFRQSGPAFVTVTSGAKGASIYINGVLTAANPQFPLCAKDFTGRLVLGDSPGQNDNWTGQVFGFAIYGQQLEAAQVFQNYLDWKQSGRPEHASDKSKIALYLFDEHMGRVARDRAQSGVDLYIPERYQVVDKIVLEPFWTEFSMTRSYWGAALKNIVGFVPFGICFYAYLSALPIKRAVLLTVALGATVSFTIEILQGFLPTRDSGTTDLITNTLGAWIGAESFLIMTPSLSRCFRRLPPLTRKRRLPAN